ncbi:hypothetical protein CL653_03215 [bacterium]|nr:hypothetical protein [bacterium]|tara:strand:- start:523 stop:1110 length:588 start_codon:yes stop_codon:yes gene_type:complete
MKILYLHGLGSSGESSTVQNLRTSLNHVFLDGELVAPTYSPQDAGAWRRFYATADEYDVIVGTSMGGYHALRLAEAGVAAPVLVVNAAFDPASMLSKYLNQPLPDYTGSSVPTVMSKEMVNQFKKPNLIKHNHVPIVWVIGSRDDVIDPQEQLAFAQSIGCEVVETNWGHRVEDSKFLVKQIRKLANNLTTHPTE